LLTTWDKQFDVGDLLTDLLKYVRFLRVYVQISRVLGVHVIFKANVCESVKKLYIPDELSYSPINLFVKRRTVNAEKKEKDVIRNFLTTYIVHTPIIHTPYYTCRK
jgi:hypothetical protein